jgi:hypothetical protein
MIDSWLREEWDSRVASATALFRQGHLLEWASVAYGANFQHGVCVPTKEAGADGTGYVKVEDVWAHVMITTQTCDICEEGKRRPIMPWISVVPVYDIMPILVGGQTKQIRANGFGYLVPLTYANFSQENTLWVADLRIEYPLEKSVLALRTPIEAFASEAEYAYLADKLASRRNRPAIDSQVRKTVIRELDLALQSGKIPHDPILEIRLRCGPTWEHVERVELFAIVRNEANVSAVEDQFDDWKESIESHLPPELSLLETTVVTEDKFSLRMARNTQAVDYSEIST